MVKCSDQSDALASNTVGNIPPPLPTQITRTLCPSTPYMLSCPPCSPHQAPRPAFLESPLLNAFRQTGGRGGQGDGLQHEEKVGDDDTHTPSTTVTTAGDAGQIVLPVFNFGIPLSAVRETGELLKPILRFGIPETSVRNKCPYWR